ncbi:HK97 gp10 family phage protein [Agrobacterium rhizogenes]|uniref:HK97-gp10 family putative phage morphogenesis protein n=1 Tax=Rhizobium rhizogenes TaxID=359 RepID=UPI0022B74E7B|nr:HK97-gp10 family putative phage morphogenesis protein [Rhizobium rhizogenes]MCZ7451037.1 HK97 gp10 family phage protein [Rhizobium rhizogenes]
MTKIRNLDRLKRKLVQLPAVAKDRIRVAMERQADRIVAMMKSLVPVDDGTLRDSIGWTWGKAPKGSMVLAKVKATASDDMTLTIYAGNSEAFYARWVEFGTARHENGGMFAGTQHPGTTAQPFFYVSWRSNKRRAVRAVRRATRQAIKKVAEGS